MSHTHGKGKNIFTTHSHFESSFHAICSYFEKHFRAIFGTRLYWQSTWLPTQHPHAYFVPCYLLYIIQVQRTIKVQPSSNAGLKGKPYQYAPIYSLLHLKTQVWISRLKHTFGHPPQFLQAVPKLNNGSYLCPRYFQKGTQRIVNLQKQNTTSLS